MYRFKSRFGRSIRSVEELAYSLLDGPDIKIHLCEAITILEGVATLVLNFCNTAVSRLVTCFIDRL